MNKIETAYRRLVAGGRPILKLFSGNPNENGFHFPPEILEEAYRGYFKRQDYHPHPKGLLKARQSISDYYERQGASVDPENIILTSGTSESFFYLFKLLAKAGDNILIPNPAYPLFNDIAELAGVELRHYFLEEVRQWAVNLESLRQRTDARTKAIALISPNNPTGAVIREDEIGEIVDWANQKGIALICDEVFCEFYFGKGRFPRPIAVSKPKLCFTLNGISKMFALPALKLGWIAVTGEKSLVDHAVDRLETTADTFLSCHIPIQEALPSIFSGGKAFLEGYKREVQRRKDLAIQLFRSVPGTKFVEPLGGFYLMAEVTKDIGLSEEDFVIRLMEETGIFVHPGYFFDYERGVHLVISSLTTPDLLKDGLMRLKDFLRRL